ncbi:Sulfurtransferase [Hordeum vulgare]|nr:Sulfurtransferase [Hordeum vulgare]
MPDSNGNGMHHEDDDDLFTDSDPVLPDPSLDGGRRRHPRPRVAPGSIGWARAAEPTGCEASLSPSMTRFGIATRFNATSSAMSEAAAASSGAVHAVPRTEPVVSCRVAARQPQGP